MPRGRPRKNPLPVEASSNVVGENQNPNETVTVNKSPTDKAVETSQPTATKKSPPVDINQICMACGTVVPDTPNKIDLAMWLDTAPYKFNTRLNDKGRIILCHKCENHLIEAIDKELKNMGCKQKFESASSYDDAESEHETEMAEYPKLNPDAFQTFVEKNRESLS